MTQILGTIRGSSGTLSGRLTAKLSAPIVDDFPTPQVVYLPQEESFEIVDGQVDITLPETETSGISYEFVFNRVMQEEQFFLADGTPFFGPTHLHTDGYYYTGSFHDPSSVRVSRQRVERLEPIHRFHAIVPNLDSCQFSELLPTGITTDRLSGGARQIANLMLSDSSYHDVLGDILFRYAGVYQADTWYRPRQWVTYAGSSWFNKSLQPHKDNAPFVGSPYWDAFALKGDPGGTGGDDTAYDASGWLNDRNAPSKHAIRDLVEARLVKQSQITGFAPLNNPIFTGSPSRNASPIAGDRSHQIPTTAWVGNEFALKTSPTLTGNPSIATDPSSDSNSGAIASTRWVRSYHKKIQVIASRESSQSGTYGVYTTLTFTSKDHDPESKFNPSTGVYTVPRSGWYRVWVWSVVVVTGATEHNGAIALYNISTGSRTVISQEFANTSTFVQPGSRLINLTANQTVRIEFYGAGANGTASSCTQAQLVIEEINV